MNVLAEFRRALLEIAGMSEGETAAHADVSKEELLAILREKLAGLEATESAPTTASSNGHGAQKPVPLAEAERLLVQGWTLAESFGPNRVLLRSP